MFRKIIGRHIKQILKWHRFVTVLMWVAGAETDSQLGPLSMDCVQCPHVWVALLWVLRLPPSSQSRAREVNVVSTLSSVSVRVCASGPARGGRPVHGDPTLHAEQRERLRPPVTQTGIGGLENHLAFVLP